MPNGNGITYPQISQDPTFVPGWVPRAMPAPGVVPRAQYIGNLPPVTTGPATLPITGPLTTNVSMPLPQQALINLRRQYAQELTDPFIRQQFMASIHAETGDQSPQAQLGYAETVLNRAAARGQSLLHTVNDPYDPKTGTGYYPESTINQLDRAFTDKEAAPYNSVINQALNGSNITNFATGNESEKLSSLARVTWNGKTDGGSRDYERFGYEPAYVSWSNRLLGATQPITSFDTGGLVQRFANGGSVKLRMPLAFESVEDVPPPAPSPPTPGAYTAPPDWPSTRAQTPEDLGAIPVTPRTVQQPKEQAKTEQPKEQTPEDLGAIPVKPQVEQPKEQPKVADTKEQTPEDLGAIPVKPSPAVTEQPVQQPQPQKPAPITGQQPEQKPITEAAPVQAPVVYPTITDEPDYQAQVQALIAQGKSPGEAQAIVAGQQPKTISGAAPQPKPQPQPQPQQAAQPITPADTLQAGKNNQVDAVALYRYLLGKFANSSVLNHPPADGAYWNIKTGSAAEWAAFALAVAKQESDLNTRSYNKADPGGSAGLFQFGQRQTQYTNGEDQFDPQKSADAFVRSVEQLVGQKGRIANMGVTFGSIKRPGEAGQYIASATKLAAGGTDTLSSSGAGRGKKETAAAGRGQDILVPMVPSEAGAPAPAQVQVPQSTSGGGKAAIGEIPEAAPSQGSYFGGFGEGVLLANAFRGRQTQVPQPEEAPADTAQTPLVMALMQRGFTPAQALQYAQSMQTIAPGIALPPAAPTQAPTQALALPPPAPSAKAPELSLLQKQPAVTAPQKAPGVSDKDKAAVVQGLMAMGIKKAQAQQLVQSAKGSNVGELLQSALKAHGQGTIPGVAGASFRPPQGAPPPAPAAPAPATTAKAPARAPQQAAPAPSEYGRPAGSTHGLANPPSFSQLTPGLKLSEAVKKHASLLSPDDPRVRKQADGMIKGEHFVEGDPIHDQLLEGLPEGKGGPQRQMLAEAEAAIADKRPMHISYLSAPKEAARYPTRETRLVQYEEHTPEARLMGTTTGQLVGHSFIPVAAGVSLPRKAGEPHQSYIQGISTNILANNFQHLNEKLASLGVGTPYKELGHKFFNDLEGYFSNLNAGHTATGRGYAMGTDDLPMEPDTSHVPYKLSRKEADFIGTVINNTAAFAKHEDGQKLRELARANGTLITEAGETNRMRHTIEQHDPGWRQRILEPSIRSFKTGLIVAHHSDERHFPETIRPGREFQELTRAIQRTSERGRPDVPIAISLHHTYQDNRLINKIERDFSDGKIDEAQARKALEGLGEDPQEYRFVKGSGGLVTPYEDDPEAITPEEHKQMKAALREQWVNGKMDSEKYRQKSAEVPLPTKSSRTSAPERINAAAARGIFGDMYEGATHSKALREAREAGEKSDAIKFGFLTDKDRFVDAEEAHRIALAAKQIDPSSASRFPRGAKPYLTSEDLDLESEEPQWGPSKHFQRGGLVEPDDELTPPKASRGFVPPEFREAASENMRPLGYTAALKLKDGEIVTGTWHDEAYMRAGSPRDTEVEAYGFAKPGGKDFLSMEEADKMLAERYALPRPPISPIPKRHFRRGGLVEPEEDSLAGQTVPAPAAPQRPPVEPQEEPEAERPPPLGEVPKPQAQPPKPKFRPAKPEEFITARDKSKRPQYLSPLHPDEIRNHKLFMTDDGKAGAAVSPEGDIQNVFNNGAPRGAGQHALVHAIKEHGGHTLDAFDPFLPKLYRQFGFKETGRMKFNPEFAPPKWDHVKDDSPDVVFMGHAGHPESGYDEAIKRALSEDESEKIPNERSEKYSDDWEAQKAASRLLASRAADHPVGGEGREEGALRAGGAPSPGAGAARGGAGGQQPPPALGEPVPSTAPKPKPKAPKAPPAELKALGGPPAPGQPLPQKAKKPPKTKEQKEAEAEDLRQAELDRKNITPEQQAKLDETKRKADAWIAANPDLPEEAAHFHINEHEDFPDWVETKEHIGKYFDQRNPRLDYAKEAHRQKAADVLTHDVMHGLSKDSSANEWYDRTVDKSFNKVGEIAPKILTHDDHNLAFKLATAITSQGQDVFPNFESGYMGYHHWDRTGKFPTDPSLFGKGPIGGGPKFQAMIANFQKANELWEKLGTQRFKEFLEKPMTIRKLREDYGIEVPGESPDYEMNGAAVFGPKIGSFFNNLNKHFDTTTFDLWNSRNMNRLGGTMLKFSPAKLLTDKAPTKTGKLRLSHLTQLGNLLDNGTIEGADPGQQAKMRKEIDKLRSYKTMTRDRALSQAPTIADWADREHRRYAMSKGYERSYAKELKTDSTGLAKNMDLNFTDLADAPKGPVQRGQWRDIYNRLKSNLSNAGIDMSHANNQAVLWYIEQALFKLAGSRNKASFDYLDAAHRLVRKVKSGALPALVGEEPMAQAA